MNSHKTISANSKGIVISFENTKKHQWISYENKIVSKRQEQIYEMPIFNANQQKIYSQTIYGLSSFTKEELNNVPETVKTNILNTWSKAQDVLNLWKSEIVSNRIDNILSIFFPNSKMVAKIKSAKPTNQEKDFNSFKDLRLSKKMIAEKLIFEGILPKNFFSL
jgi:hypothetical protein